MKPPYLKKLTKKQLKKEYTRQWREAIRANGEIYKGNIQNDQLHEVIRQQEQEINTKGTLITEHFAEIQNLKYLLDHERRERTKVELEAVDLEEALSRSRQLRKSFQEVADRHTWERAKIEDMARNLYEVIRAEVEPVAKEVFWEGHYKDRDWSKLSDNEKDRFRVHATYIISHLPTDDKQDWQTLDEGSAG